MDIHELCEAISGLYDNDYSKLFQVDPELPDLTKIDTIQAEPIDYEKTIVGDIKRKLQEQNELVKRQFEVLVEQNKLLADNYNKLRDMYDSQTKANQAAQEDLRRSRNFNRWMMFIAVIAMLAAIAGPIVTVLVSR